MANSVRRGRWIITGVLCVLAGGGLWLVLQMMNLGHVDAAIGDLRVLAAAQDEYARLNGGFSEGDLSCLERTGGCMRTPSVDTGRRFKGRTTSEFGIAKAWARAGHEFSPGEPVEQALVAERGLSPSSVRGFRATVEPGASRPRWARSRLLGGTTGAFCTDATGRVCWLPSMPKARSAVCPPDCKTL